MSTYLLTCQCGKSVPVEVGQAGGRVTCSCGAQLDVPTLRMLRHLPVAQSEAAKSQASWDARKGFAAAALIVAGLLVAFALWNRINEPKVMEFDPARQIDAANKGLEKLTPAESWHFWVHVYQPLAKSGFAVFEDPRSTAIQQDVAQRRVQQTTLLIIAAICVAIALTAALWPRTTNPRANR